MKLFAKFSTHLYRHICLLIATMQAFSYRTLITYYMYMPYIVLLNEFLRCVDTDQSLKNLYYVNILCTIYESVKLYLGHVNAYSYDK